MSIDLINEILFWICLYVLLWNGYFLLVNRGTPNIRTVSAIRQDMIKRLQEEAKKSGKDEFIIYDLGSGGGTFSREIALAIPNARVTGIEIAKPAYWKSLLVKKLRGPKNVHYRNEDLYKSDISDADAIVMFLLGRFMGTTRPKLEKDLKEGTLVLSNKFKIGGDWEPLETIDVKTLAPHQKTYFVYRR